MEFTEFMQAVFDSAKKKGCDAAEVYYAVSDSQSVDILDGIPKEYEVSNSGGVNLRVKYAGRDGYAFTQLLSEPERLAERAIDNAKIIGAEDEHPMAGRSEYRALEKTRSAFSGKTPADLIAMGIELEKETLSQDGRVKRVAVCSFIKGRSSVVIANTLGLYAGAEKETSLCVLDAVVQEGDEIKSGFIFKQGDEAKEIKATAKEAVNIGLSKLGADTIKTGAYNAVISNEAMGAILEAFVPMFYASNAQKGKSPLAGMEGKQIASPSVTITDDPFNSIMPRAFDGEGVPSLTKSVVENGVLKTLLHNLQTAKKAGVKTTANGGRAGAASVIDVLATNFYILPGESTPDNALKTVGDGLYITDVTGLHAGVNEITGDFSISCSGFEVKDGKKARPVDQITMAGTFFDLMKSVSLVCGDLYFGYPSAGQYVGSPSVMVKDLMIAGGEKA